MAVIYKLGDDIRKQPRIVNVNHLWAAVEEGHFTWGQRGPPSTPDSEVGSVRDVEDEGQIDNVAGCVDGAQAHPEDEPVSEPSVSRPLRSRKRPQWWTDYTCGSDCE